MDVAMLFVGSRLDGGLDNDGLRSRKPQGNYIVVEKLCTSTRSTTTMSSLARPWRHHKGII
jgi:hypothetical protein